jgi:predicted peroxiredoxin
MRQAGPLHDIMRTVGFIVATTVAGGLFAAVPHWRTGDPAYAGAAQDNPKRVVVHLTHTTDDLHAAFMALKLASVLQSSGASVHLFVDLEGARVADKRVPGDLRWGSGDTTLGELYDALVKAGGTVVVCPHCATAAGLDQANLRRGARIGTLDEIGQILMEADVIMDY